MKFPITRETLQELTVEKVLKERAEEESEKKLNEVLEEVCFLFQSGIKFAVNEKKFVWRMRNNHNFLKQADYLERLIEKLKEKFIGCDIIIDPLKTYVIIDWS